MKAPEVSISDDPGAVAGEALSQALSQAISARGRARLAVPGGTGPVPVFRWLAANLPPEIAQKTTLTWVDERHLPCDPATPWEDWPLLCNRRTTWEHWLSQTPHRPAEVPLGVWRPLSEARAEVEQVFLREMGGALDVVLLGMGPDGHIASLFPGHPALAATAPVLAISDSPKPPPQRLTLSLPVLAGADLVVLVATGAEKGEVLRRALSGEDLPLSRLSPRGRYLWALDAAADPLPGSM